MRSMKEAENLRPPLNKVILSNGQRIPVSPAVSFPVNIKELNHSNDYMLTVNSKWNISQVKEAISVWHHKQISLVFSGMQLNDEMTLEDVGIQNATYYNPLCP